MNTIKVDVAVNGSNLTIEMDVTAFVKWENRAKKAGVSTGKFLSLFLSKEVQRTR